MIYFSLPEKKKKKNKNKAVKSGNNQQIVFSHCSLRDMESWSLFSFVFNSIIFGCLSGAELTTFILFLKTENTHDNFGLIRLRF